MITKYVVDIGFQALTYHKVLVKSETAKTVITSEDRRALKRADVSRGANYFDSASAAKAFVLEGLAEEETQLRDRMKALKRRVTEASKVTEDMFMPPRKWGAK